MPTPLLRNAECLAGFAESKRLAQKKKQDTSQSAMDTLGDDDR
jgi:hypothetical protein